MFATKTKQADIPGKKDKPKSTTLQKKDKPVNRTGLPDRLKNGIENLSGLSMDDVRVHYNSPRPAQL